MKINKKMTIIIVVITLLVGICIFMFARKNRNENIRLQEEKRAEGESSTEYIETQINNLRETDTEYNFTLTFTVNDENDEIQSIEYPDNEDILNVPEGKKSIAIDYKVSKDEANKIFTIKTKNNKTEKRGTGYTIKYHNNPENINEYQEMKYFKGNNADIEAFIPETPGYVFRGYTENINNKYGEYFKTYTSTDSRAIIDMYGTWVKPDNYSVLGALEKINESGVQKIYFNKTWYDLDVILVNGNLNLDGTEKNIENIVMTGTSTYTYSVGNIENDIGTGAIEYAKNTVVLKVKGDLTIDSNSTLTSCVNESGYGGPKGLIIYADGTITNNGTISMTARGARAEGQDIYLWKNKSPIAGQDEYEYIPAEGEIGGAIVKVTTPWNKSTGKYDKISANGKKGEDGINRKTGGGGSGGAHAHYTTTQAKVTVNSGAGANGTSYSGGSGGGGISRRSAGKAGAGLINGCNGGKGSSHEPGTGEAKGRRRRSW